jgi:hypothetical protein
MEVTIMDKIDVRMSQLIYTWGVGSIIPLPNGASGIVAGLDKWDNQDSSFIVHDDRLAKRLGLKALREPPYFTEKGKSDDDSKKTIPIFAFPTWYYCPVCHSVEKIEMSDNNIPPECPNCHAKYPKSHFKMVPERFIVVCPEGHLADLPILQLLHGKDFNINEWLNKTSELHKNHQIKRFSSDKTSSLGGISYHCSCGKSFSISDLVGTNKEKLLEAFGGKCPGTRPWFGNNSEECSHNPNELKIVQRGGTNVWYPSTISSICLPVSNDDCVNFIKENLQIIKNVFTSINDEKAQRNIISSLSKNSFTFEEIKDAYKKANEETNESLSEKQYRYQEYLALRKDCGGDKQDLYVSCLSMDNFSPLIKKLFSGISKIKRLKETTALIGFSRLVPQSHSFIESSKLLSLNHLDWTPAIQVTGEGMFLEFNNETIKKWRENDFVSSREQKLNESFKKLPFNNGYFDSVTAPYVLIHTFAHVFINELSKECGYGSSSLRERLYVSDDKENLMNGVLIYTSSGDSEGSLGGLVRQAEKENFEYILESAIKEASWCSSDPVCINSEGQGPDSCNLAACFSCSLLPETCCETGNRFLDRGMLIGNPAKNENFGYFSDILGSNL